MQQLLAEAAIAEPSRRAGLETSFLKALKRWQKEVLKRREKKL
jgi:hypothetical protein